MISSNSFWQNLIWTNNILGLAACYGSAVLVESSGIIITEMKFNNETSMSPPIVHDNCGKWSKKDREIHGIIQLK